MEDDHRALTVEKGRVRLAVTAPSGKEATCVLLGAGAFLGEEALIGQARRRQTAIAMTAVDVLVVTTAQMHGRTRSHVNALMGKFRKLGFIEKVGERLEVNAFLLRVIHDADRGVPNGTS